MDVGLRYGNRGIGTGGGVEVLRATMSINTAKKSQRVK